MNYADLRQSIINEWNSNNKFTNEYLIELGAEVGTEIKNAHADRKSIVASVVDGLITAGVESGQYEVSDMGEGSVNDIWFKNYMGVVPIPTPTLKLDDSPIVTFEELDVAEDEDEEEELPNFKKMSKKKLDDWALDRGIELDRRKTKAHMITELNKKL